MTNNSDAEFCANCNRALKNLEHGKCMYCGHSLPERLKLSAEDAKEIRKTKHDQWKEDSRKRLWGNKPRTEGESLDFSGDWGWQEHEDAGGGSGDGGGGDGGGD